MDIEEWKPAIHRGNVVEGLFVSNFGNCKKKLKNRESVVRIYSLTYKERGNKQEINFKRKHYLVHRLICETFKPMEQFPPIPVADWANTPESAKQIIKNCMLVDHIDNNPFNNRIENLRWVTPWENNSAVKKRESAEQG